MHTITFTSDLGDGSPYLASLKGMLLQRLQTNISFVNINNNIKHYDLEEAAYIINKCYKDFPKNTIHLVLLNLPGGSKTGLSFSSLNDQHFIVPDIRFFSLLDNAKPEKVYSISEIDEIQNKDFSVKERIADFTADYIKNTSVVSQYPLVEEIETYTKTYPTRYENAIKGSVAYVDHYLNLVTNIDQELFDKVGKGKSFEIVVDRSHSIEKIVENYFDVKEGSLLSLFNKQGYLVIAINKGKAFKLLGYDPYKGISIYFK